LSKECADRVLCSSYAFEAATARGSEVAVARKMRISALKKEKGPGKPGP
jgi:hypothetical protein